MSHLLERKAAQFLKSVCDAVGDDPTERVGALDLAVRLVTGGAKTIVEDLQKRASPSEELKAKGKKTKE